MASRNGRNEDLGSRFRRRFIPGVLGGAAGAAVGAYLSVIQGRQLYIPIGSILGILLGEAVAAALSKRWSSESVERLGRAVVIAMALLGFAFACVGVLAFVISGQLAALIAALASAAAGVFFLIRAIRGSGLP